MPLLILQSSTRQLMVLAAVWLTKEIQIKVIILQSSIHPVRAWVSPAKRWALNPPVRK